MTKDKTYCCEKFAADVRESKFELITFDADSYTTWVVAGCCGGGCYVISDMQYCPYCGTQTDTTGV